MTQLLWQFSYLQVLDFLTTLAFLLQGVQEGNPIVRLAIQVSPNPLTGLLIIKLVAVGLALICWRMGRDRLLFRMNLLFALVVAWNMVAIVLRTAS